MNKIKRVYLAYSHKKLIKYPVFLFFILLFLLISCSNPVKENIAITNPVTAYASVDKTEATIGDIITFNLNIDYAEGVKIIYPDLKKSLADFTITSEKRTKPALVDNRWEEVFTF